MSVIYTEISDSDINMKSAFDKVRCNSAGGNSVFVGTVRDTNDGRSVEGLSYEVYRAMAEKSIRKICEQAQEKFGLDAVCAYHREGYLSVGDVAIYVAASATHRAEAIRGVESIVHDIKHQTPIWKLEHYIDGERTWVQCHHD